MESFPMKHLPLPKALWLIPQAGRHNFVAGRTAILFSSGEYSLAIWSDTGAPILDAAEVANLSSHHEDVGEPVTRLAERMAKKLRRFDAQICRQFIYMMFWRYQR